MPEPHPIPLAGLAGNRHHDYSHATPGAPASQRAMRDICRWHCEEFAYLLERMKAVPEGDGTLLDNTIAISTHEHTEANPHKCRGMGILVAGGGGRITASTPRPTTRSATFTGR